MKILAFDTSNTAMSVAIVDNKKLLAEKTINIRKNHSLQLMPTIDELMRQVQLEPSDLDRIVVAEGPGSYTGLRIAATTAKTLAWTLNIDLVGVSSLQVLAQNHVSSKGQYVCPLFDARRGNFYTGLYQVNELGKAVSIEPDTHISLEEWIEFLNGIEAPIHFVGEDAWKVKETIKEELQEQAVFNSWTCQLPSAEQLAHLGTEKEPVDIHMFVPQYLRIAEAEANWLERHSLSENEELVEKF